MNFNSAELRSIGLDSDLLDFLIDEHLTQAVPHLERLWSYYRNDMVDWGVAEGERRYSLAQEEGLGSRLRGGGGQSHGQPRREVVIENDIAWRIDTLVDFIFGKPIILQSCASDRGLGERIESFLHRVFELNGGVRFFQNLALLGSVHGYVDVLVRVGESVGRVGRDSVGVGSGAVEGFNLDIVEAPRSIPVLNPDDYRRVDAYVVHFRRVLNELADRGFLSRLSGGVLGLGKQGSHRATAERTEVWTDRVVAVFDGGVNKRQMVEESVNRLGRIPLVHIQNLPQPFFYEGLSEVEPLVPLQDELNTRLSDRANRVTFQSFKMYLGKGIEGFTERPVGPGQMWSTDNPDASIQEFGGDSQSPSEDAHINEIREAMDKASAVTPVAAGLIRDRLGNLTSGNALRITLMGLLSKTERKRVTYGKGVSELCELILHAADVYGVLPNRPEDRRVRIDWPGILPENESERLREAQLKLELGVPKRQVLTELGYGDCVDTV